jgi:hypothetical protein
MQLNTADQGADLGGCHAMRRGVCALESCSYLYCIAAD